MKTVSLRIDDATFRRAQDRAAAEGTTVEAIVRTFLAEYATSAAESDGPPRESRALVALAEAVATNARYEDRDWTREDLYADRLRKP